MSDLQHNVFGARLKLARKMAGLSLQQLADCLDNIISKQSLNKYEQGIMKPSSQVLLALSKALDVQPDYFLREKTVGFGKVQFRKKKSLNKRDEDSIIEHARNYVERYMEIEKILGIESVFANPIENIKIQTKDDVQKAAKKLREYWELGTNPIPNIVEMIELKGVKVMLMDDKRHFDGFTVYTSDNSPIIIINTHEISIERLRFTTIHELAHLILNFSKEILDDEKLVEEMCHYFSSCFLIPTKEIWRMIGGGKRSYIKIEELIAVKEYFGISLRAFVHRLKGLGIITSSYYQRWVIWLSKEFGAKNEPGNYIGEEKPRSFESLINRALAEGIISIGKAAELLNTNINSLRKQSIGSID